MCRAPCIVLDDNFAHNVHIPLPVSEKITKELVLLIWSLRVSIGCALKCDLNALYFSALLNCVKIVLQSSIGQILGILGVEEDKFEMLGAESFRIKFGFSFFLV